jgi:hypothetical protein
MEIKLLGKYLINTLIKSRRRDANTRGILACHHRMDETLPVRDRIHPKVRAVKSRIYVLDIQVLERILNGRILITFSAIASFALLVGRFFISLAV